MTIVPANEAPYRPKMRRRLTLDLFTRYGTFWSAIDELRRTWHVSPVAAVPPEPDFHAEAVGLMDRSTMPERFHMPDCDPFNLAATVAELRTIDDDHEIDGMDSALGWMQHDHERTRVGTFLLELREIWRSELVDDRRSGTNETGWMTWTPFLSACVLYDPPRDRLLDFANYDDHVAAALEQRTFWQDAHIAADARTAFTAAIVRHDAVAGVRAMELQRASMRESETYVPRGKRGRQPNDLQDVQCAIWRRDGMSTADIGRKIGRSVRDNADTYEPGTSSYRERSDAAEDAVKRGLAILNERNAIARIIGE